MSKRENDEARGSRQAPDDPTELTDKAIAKAITLMTQYVDGKFAVIEQIVNDRNTAITLVNSERREQFATLKELLEDRIAGIERLTTERFSSAEQQRLEQKKDTKDAVDAALTAQKEAVREQTVASERSIAKSEAATSKQLEQQALTSTTAVESLRRSIDEVKERAVEENRAMRTSISEVATTANGTVQQKVGSTENRVSSYATAALIVSVVLVLIAIITFILVTIPKVGSAVS